MKHTLSKIILIMVGMIGCFAGSIQAEADPYTENFDQQNGWFVGGTGMALSQQDGCLIGSFGTQGFPAPETGLMQANAQASSGHFCGDYRAGGITLIGFTCLAKQAVPSAIRLYLQSPHGTVFRTVAPAIEQVETWYTVQMSLSEKSAGEWGGADTEAFNAILCSITNCYLGIMRNGSAAQQFCLDRFFIDYLPQCSFDDNQISVSNVRQGLSYTIQMATNLLASEINWTNISAFNVDVADGIHRIPIEELSSFKTNNPIYIRISAESLQMKQD